MKAFQHYSPTEIVFGEGAEKQTGELAKKHGGTRVFVVYGGNFSVKSGLLDTDLLQKKYFYLQLKLNLY